MSQIVVGRQPIYGRGLGVYGYELLFRDAADAGGALFQDADRATATVMLHAFLDLGMERVVGSRKAFLNGSRSFVVGDLLYCLDPQRFVIELLESIEPDAAVLRGARRLSEAGFALALDDYVHRSGMEALLELADIVKLDCRALGLDGVEQHARLLAPWGVKLVAEKVETHAELERCRDLGIDYFQGHFLARPRIVEGRRVPAGRLTLSRVLAQVNDPNTSVEELGLAIEQDVGLTYALLRHVNSVLYALPRRVEKVRDVVMVLGLDKIRSLVSLLLLAQVDDKPPELVSTALVRARMCELLCDRSERAEAAAYFATGLLSTLDALLDVPLPSVIDQLPLAEGIKSALLGTSRGRLRRCLECALAYERGDWEGVRRTGLSLADAGRSYLSALDYARSVERELDRSAA